METRLDVRGWLKAPARGAASPLLALLLLAGVAGCGARQSEQTAAGSKAGSESSTQAGTVAGRESSVQTMVVAAAQDPATGIHSSRPTGPIHRITLSDKRCVRFEPQWTNVRMGQSVTWHSDLKSPVRIYVSPGVFAKASYLVRPGTTVSTGPALAPGRYAFWSEPKACRQAPRGWLLAGPGVRVQQDFYASTGPR